MSVAPWRGGSRGHSVGLEVGLRVGVAGMRVGVVGMRVGVGSVVAVVIVDDEARFTPR